MGRKKAASSGRSAPAITKSQHQQTPAAAAAPATGGARRSGKNVPPSQRGTMAAGQSMVTSTVSSATAGSVGKYVPPSQRHAKDAGQSMDTSTVTSTPSPSAAAAAAGGTGRYKPPSQRRAMEQASQQPASRAGGGLQPTQQLGAARRRNGNPELPDTNDNKKFESRGKPIPGPLRRPGMRPAELIVVPAKPTPPSQPHAATSGGHSRSKTKHQPQAEHSAVGKLADAGTPHSPRPANRAKSTGKTRSSAASRLDSAPGNDVPDAGESAPEQRWARFVHTVLYSS
eukprot:scpid93053/ scgid28301/ 